MQFVTNALWVHLFCVSFATKYSIFQAELD